MQIATILPIPYLDLVGGDDTYHMCLAHLLDNKEYLEYFRGKSRRGDSVIMDNGVVETGLPMEMSILLELADKVEATELILPDRLNDAAGTLILGADAIGQWYGETGLIAVPQGNTFEEWHACMKEMLFWPVSTIGISKFTAKFSSSRLEILKKSPELIESIKGIHLLGCVAINDEISSIGDAFPGRIKGTDSGIAAIATQAGVEISKVKRGDRVNVELDFFNRNLDEYLLNANIGTWRSMCQKGI
jgi:hypothetical protein